MSLGTHSSVVLHLDSRYATSYLETGLSTNFIYNLVEPIEVPDHETCEVSLYTATIPYSFYNVRPGVNDQLKLKVGSEAEKVITLTPGNYSATGLKAELQRLVSAIPATPNTHPKLRQVVFDTTYSRETLKYSFSASGPIGTDTLSIDFMTAKGLFGFKATSTGYIVFHGTSSNGPRTLTSEICIDINDSIHGLYIRQNLTTKSTLDNENGVFTNILARIPINTNPGGIIFHSPANTTHHATASLRVIQSIGIKLTDDANRAIDLNGLHFQISLLISFKPLPERVKPVTRESRRQPQMITRGNQGMSIIEQRRQEEEERQRQIQEAELKIRKDRKKKR